MPRPPHRFAVAVGATLVALSVRLVLNRCSAKTSRCCSSCRRSSSQDGMGGGRLASWRRRSQRPLPGSFWLTPEFSSIVGTTTESRALALFALVGVVVSWITESLHRSAGRERKAAEHANRLVAARQRTTGLLSNIPGVVWEAYGEPDAALQRIDFVSDYVETMLGYAPERWPVAAAG